MFQVVRMREEARRKIWFPVCLVIILLPLYLFHLDRLPFSFHGDEAETALQALQILFGRTGITGVGWFDQPLISFVPHAISMWIFGFTITGDRLGSVIFGLGSVPFMYLLVREMYGDMTARFASILFGVSHMWVALSRLGIVYVQAACIMLASFYFFMRGIRRASKRSVFVSGICAGLGMYSYAAGRIIPIIISLYMMITIIRKENLLKMISYYVFFVLGFIIIFSPLGVFYLRHMSTFSGRISDVYIFSHSAAMDQWRSGEYGGDGVSQILLKQVSKTVNIFRGDGSGQYGLKSPLIDFVTLGLFIIGIISAIRQKRDAVIFSFIWIASTLIIGVVLTASPFFLPRFVVGLPVVYIFCGIGLKTLWKKISPFGKFGRFLFLVTIGYIVLFNIVTYFVVYPKQLQLNIAGDTTAKVATRIGQYLAEHKDYSQATLYTKPYISPDFSTFRFFLFNTKGALFSSKEQDGLEPTCPDKAIYFFYPKQFVYDQDVMGRCPGGFTRMDASGEILIYSLHKY